MRILIDECLDWRLCRVLVNHHCTSVVQAGWSGLSNGLLLRKAQEEFDVFLTGDRNLRFQQSLSNVNLAVIVLEARSTRLVDTIQLMPQVLLALKTIQSGEVVRIALRS